VAGDGVTRLPLDVAEGALELLVSERLDLAAVVADEVMVVLAVGVERLEAVSARTDVDPLEEAVAAELVERSVDARDPVKGAIIGVAPQAAAR
jgi:hypothetical protein